MRKILVDCDPGVDDICALQFLFNRKDIEVVAITVVHGNCAASIGAQNALKLLTLNNLQVNPSSTIRTFFRLFFGIFCHERSIFRRKFQFLLGQKLFW